MNVRDYFFRGQMGFRIMEIIRHQFALRSKFESIFFQCSQTAHRKCTQLQLYKTRKTGVNKRVDAAFYGRLCSFR
jgi:hypothetical protein